MLKAGNFEIEFFKGRIDISYSNSRNEDLNLAALISAVEKDIWYMEQLESNPSVLRL